MHLFLTWLNELAHGILIGAVKVSRGVIWKVIIKTVARFNCWITSKVWFGFDQKGNCMSKREDRLNAAIMNNYRRMSRDHAGPCFLLLICRCDEHGEIAKEELKRQQRRRRWINNKQSCNKRNVKKQKKWVRRGGGTVITASPPLISLVN